MTVVEFLLGRSPYNAGELAGFEDEDARRLVASGAARLYVPAVETTEAEDAEVENETSPQRPEPKPESPVKAEKRKK